MRGCRDAFGKLLIRPKGHCYLLYWGVSRTRPAARLPRGLGKRRHLLLLARALRLPPSRSRNDGPLAALLAGPPPGGGARSRTRRSREPAERSAAAVICPKSPASHLRRLCSALTCPPGHERGKGCARDAVGRGPGKAAGAQGGRGAAALAQGGVRSVAAAGDGRVVRQGLAATDLASQADPGVATPSHCNSANGQPRRWAALEGLGVGARRPRQPSTINVCVGDVAPRRPLPRPAPCRGSSSTCNATIGDAGRWPSRRPCGGGLRWRRWSRRQSTARGPRRLVAPPPAARRRRQCHEAQGAALQHPDHHAVRQGLG